MLERSRAAHLKVCGDFLSAEALDLLDYLGIDTAALGATRVGRLTLATGGKAAGRAVAVRRRRLVAPGAG
ncbi:MAG: hypothetical protein WDM94_13570 [Bauldia sp.]